MFMGSLSRFSAIEVVSLIVQGRKSGVLSIEAGGGYRIRFESGRIVGAAFDSPGPDSTAADLVVRAMLQEHGSFTFFDAKPGDVGKVDLDPLPLIERARLRISESEGFERSFVFLLARDFDCDEMFSANEVRILCEADGRLTVGDLMERSGLPEVVVRKVIGSLIRRGWLIPREGSKAIEPPAETPAAPRNVPADVPPPEREGAGQTVPDLGAAGRSGGVSRQRTLSGRIACFTLDDTNSTSYPLFDDVQTIGRGRQNTIRIDDKSVSSSHARITQTPDGHMIEDLGSSNGTFVNGKRIEQAILKDRDRLRLGTVFMVYMIPAEVSRQSTEEESPS